MNILYISPFFYPEKISTGRYNNFVVGELIKNGHHVEVICSHPLYPEWVPVRSSCDFNGAKIYRGGLWVRYSPFPLIRRFILEFWFSLHVFYTLMVLRHRPTKVIIVSPPSLYVLVVAFFFNKANLIAIVHDLQGVFAGKKGFLGGLLRLAINFVEGSAFRRCNKVIFLSKDMRSQSVLFYGLGESKTEVCYPFISFEKTDRIANESDFNEYLDVNFFSVVYSGALGEKQNPEGLIGFLNHLLKLYPNWKAYIFSSGPIFEKFKNLNTNSRLIFRPLVPDELLIQLISRSDVQLVPQATGTSKGSLPSKIPNLVYFGARILCVTDENSELGHLLFDYPSSRVVNSWDLNELMRSFEELILTEKVRVGSSKVLERFSIKDLIIKLENSV